MWWVAYCSAGELQTRLGFSLFFSDQSPGRRFALYLALNLLTCVRGPRRERFLCSKTPCVCTSNKGPETMLTYFTYCTFAPALKAEKAEAAAFARRRIQVRAKLKNVFFQRTRIFPDLEAPVKISIYRRSGVRVPLVM